MATAVCSSSRHSPTLPTVSLSFLTPKSVFRTPHYVQLPAHLSSKFSFTLPSDDALTVAAVAEAMALANAAAEAARDAVASAKELGYKESGHEVERDWRNGSGVRRKRRRNRRKGLKSSEIEIDRYGEDNEVSFRDAKSGHYLTRKEEAEYTLYIKEEARLEAVRRRIRETSEHEPNSSQWAKAVGMGGSSLNNILCRGRESRERINCSYRRLVVSIAACYQGKGLSLQDLIQEGSIGLLRGANKFNPERGYKLSTYVYWWIRQAVTKAIANKSTIIRLPPVMCRAAYVRRCRKLQRPTIS